MDTQSAGKFSFLVDRSFEKLLSTEFTKTETVNFKVANFIGWQAQIDGEMLPISTNQELGNIMLEVPAGNHKIGLYFSENTPVRKIGDTISVLALFISLYLFYPFAKQQNSSQKDSTKLKH